MNDMATSSSKLQNSSIRDLRIFCFLIFSFLYGYYIYLQNIDIFFEAQFLHTSFLEDLVSNHMTMKGFFTVFGEHIFPGYNLILALNYYLFDIWGGFDAVVHAIAVITTASLIIFNIQRNLFISKISYSIAIIFSSVTLLSTTKNPQWSMALAATIGVAISAYFLLRYSQAVMGNRKLTVLELACIPIAIIFFLGGYSLGLIAAVAFAALIGWVHKIDSRKNLVAPLLVLLISMAIYCILVAKLGSLFGNRPTSDSFDLISCIKFLVVLSASGALGRAFFEGSHFLLPYYFLGSVLIIWSLVLIVRFLKSPQSNSLFFFCLLIYSLANIFIVSLFRYKNGTEGGMGQWYTVHTQFLPFVIMILLCKTIDFKNISFTGVTKIGSVLVIALFTIAGYVYDFRKAPYVKPWKEQFIAQAIPLLVAPDEIKDKENSMNTMLWDYPTAKHSINFLYKNSLWMFRKKEMLTTGITSDNWVTADKPALILCPSGSNLLSFNAWRPESSIPSSIRVKTQSFEQIFNIDDSLISVDLGRVPFAYILSESRSAIQQATDQRRLIFNISNINCNRSNEDKMAYAIDVLSWGPQFATKSVNPNTQPNGDIGFWIRAEFDKNRFSAKGFDVYFGETKVDLVILQEGLITFGIQPSILNTSGIYSLDIRDKSVQCEEAKTNNCQINIGEFRVD
jgi:hypothetical protein